MSLSRYVTFFIWSYMLLVQLEFYPNLFLHRRIWVWLESISFLYRFLIHAIYVSLLLYWLCHEYICHVCLWLLIILSVVVIELGFSFLSLFLPILFIVFIAFSVICESWVSLELYVSPFCGCAPSSKLFQSVLEWLHAFGHNSSGVDLFFLAFTHSLSLLWILLKKET